MKLLAACVASVALLCQVSAGPGAVVGIITDILDLTLSIGNVVSGGCIYYPEICTLDKSIRAIEKEVKPKLVRLDNLDKENSVLYKDMTDALANNNDLSQQTGNLQFLVISITRKLGNSAQTYDRLAAEFEAKTNHLLTVYRQEMANIKQNAITKTIVLGILDGSKLLYQGLKFSYKKLKEDGKISSTKSFKTEVVKARPLSLALQPITNPRWYKAKQTYNRFSTWWNKPSVTKIRGYVKEAGVVVGSLFSLGVSVTVDVLMAKNMRDTMRQTENELRDIQRNIDGYIQSEKKVNDDLKAAFVTTRKSFADLSKVLGDNIAGVSSNKIMGTKTPGSLLPLQRKVIAEYAKLQKQLQEIDLNVEVQQIITMGVEFGDSLSRISYTIKRNGYNDVTEDQILKVIAKDNPKMQKYDGKSLSKYRG